MKPSLPQGTRDFGPDIVRKRNYIFSTIRGVFELYGFQPLETPAMENLDTLMGKYGEEGNKLIFRILNNGLNDPKNIGKARVAFENLLEGKNDTDLTERALRYDLTIPFARYVAMNHGQLSFPFKRYQMQPVWRADRPAKGRYREFYQCDADVVGSRSLLNEVELGLIYLTVFRQLGIGVSVKLNSRKILAALADTCGGADKMMDITIAIDKLDKIGLPKVKEELDGRGLDNRQIDLIEKYLLIGGSNTEKLAQVKNLLGQNDAGRNGIEEIEFVLSYLEPHLPSPVSRLTNSGTTNSELPTPDSRLPTPDSRLPTPDSRLPTPDSRLEIDFTLARGLNYYTGLIFEVKALDVAMGSIGGGGRYDDLTGLFGVPNIPGVGISFGVDRIYDVMEALQLFPPQVQTGTQALFFNLGEAESKAAFGIMQQLRAKGVRCEIYHEPAKFDKQFKYAEKKNINFIVIIGSKELEEKTGVIKDLSTGQQQTLPQEQITGFAF